MPSITTRVMLPSDPHTVFAMIRKVEDFPQYTPAIEAVVPLGQDRYRWHVRVAGATYAWDVEVTLCEPPHRLTWHSVSGIRNTGRYLLVPAPGGTHVTLVIDYSLNSRLLDRTVGHLAMPIVRRLMEEILKRVRQRLAAHPA